MPGHPAGLGVESGRPTESPVAVHSRKTPNDGDAASLRGQMCYFTKRSSCEPAAEALEEHFSFRPKSNQDKWFWPKATNCPEVGNPCFRPEFYWLASTLAILSRFTDHFRSHGLRSRRCSSSRRTPRPPSFPGRNRSRKRSPANSQRSHRRYPQGVRRAGGHETRQAGHVDLWRRDFPAASR